MLLTVVEDVMSVFFVIKVKNWGFLFDPVTVNCLCALFIRLSLLEVVKESPSLQSHILGIV